MSADARGYMPVGARDDHGTPIPIFEALDEEFGPFNIDPCGSKEHHYTAHTIYQRGGIFFDGSVPALDGLKQPWSIPASGRRPPQPGIVFMNPPYGKNVRAWIAKAVSEVEEGNAQRVVALLKATTDVRWWQQYVLKEAAFDRIAGHELLLLVRFVKGRLRFLGAPGPAPFPSAIVVWEKS